MWVNELGVKGEKEMALKTYVTYKGRKYRYALGDATKKGAERYMALLWDKGYSAIIRSIPKGYGVYAVTRNKKGGYGGYMYHPEATMKMFDKKPKK